jgi:hypothetical protein
MLTIIRTNILYPEVKNHKHKITNIKNEKTTLNALHPTSSYHFMQ